MDLSRATTKFATNDIDGFDGVSWTTGIGKGSLEVFSRFITERTFGTVRRILTTHEEIADEYKLLRLATGEIFLKAYENTDLNFNVSYGKTYLLQEITHYGTVINFTKTLTASGMSGETIETMTYDVPCFLDRISSEKAGDELNFMYYTKVKILLPSYIDLEVGSELEVGGNRYAIRERDMELYMQRLYAGLK